jgi:hypothetical protein
MLLGNEVVEQLTPVPSQSRAEPTGKSLALVNYLPAHLSYLLVVNTSRFPPAVALQPTIHSLTCYDYQPLPSLPIPRGLSLGIR